MTNLPVSLRDVEEAATRIKGRVRETPLLEAPLLNDILGFRLLVKAECLQVTGAFKTRGAFNQILQLTPEEKKRGVVAFSSGNHAQAVAWAAKSLDVPATIIMPEDAPQLKLKNTRAYGAKVVTYHRTNENREALGRKIADESGLTLIHPFDAERTIAGQGTVGLEIFRQSQDLGIVPDILIIPCSGGGFAAGVALTGDLYKTPPQLYTAEPKDFDDGRRSLESGTLVSNTEGAQSKCDALLSLSLGKKPFAILQHHGVKGLAASDEEAFAAMALAAEHFKLVLEPSGALALACAWQNRATFKGKTVVVVASGGNTDVEAYAEMIRIKTSIVTPPAAAR